MKTPSRDPASSSASPAYFLTIGFIFHAVYLISIFDIYFTSPVVKVGQRFSLLDPIQGEPVNSRFHAEPLASRVVLIVGDGLRADKLFSLYPQPPFDPPLPVPILPDLKPIPTLTHQLPHNKTTPAPYLRALIETGQASWGISHTRVPTESRPGHVAIIAGMYEDVSAVTRGWKMNPVNFDSVFNQSSHSFTFGSPDILPMFKHGASDPSRVDAWSYDEEAEDFTKDAAQLDVWVLERLQSFLSDAKKAGPGSPLDRQLRSNQVFFFLHLLGLDCTGHSYRPHSPEYFRNIQVVDQVVRGAQQLIDNFYGDDRTAYIFTADHGMSNIGNHGDGDPDNTRTPLVAWGSGIQRGTQGATFDLRLDQSLHSDPYYENWHLNMTQRKDVEQADIAALMAGLTGIRVPSNSVGRLPLQYLDASEEKLARAAYANMREILQQYETKDELKASTKFCFRSFPDLPNKENLKKPSILERLFLIHRLILTSRTDEAMKACGDLQDLALQGLKYLQRYDWFLLRTIIVIGYVGWMTYSAIYVLRTYIIHPSPRDHVRFGSILGAVLFAVTSLYFYLERSPITYYLYVLFPAYFWGRIIDDVDTLQDLIDWVSSRATTPTRAWSNVLMTLISLEFMVLGYFHRTAWTIGWIVVGLGWPMLGMPARFRESHRSLLLAWATTSLFTSVFTVLPAEKGENIVIITIGGLAFLSVGYVIRRRYKHPSRLQLALIMAALLVTIDSTRRLQNKTGLPLVNQVIGWILVGSSIGPLLPKSRRITPPLPQESQLTSRLIEIIFAYVPVFIILSLSYETLFYLAFSGSLLIWLELEVRLAEFNQDDDQFRESGIKSRLPKAVVPISNFRLSHCRSGLFYLFFIHVGFFGTGNVGSMSSFYLEPVYRLVPIFNPFLMSSLLVCKILIPFLIVSSTSTSLNFILRLPKFSLFISTLVITDLMTLNFFFLVTDHGSWLEIGQSISHFAISSLLLVFMILLHFLVSPEERAPARSTTTCKGSIRSTVVLIAPKFPGMIAKSVFAYLEPYLPYQIVYGISAMAFFFEKFILPKVYHVYSNASLDPKSLIPFIISAIALYLSIVSIYHAFRAAFKMVWFLIKWSIVIVSVWVVLAFVNDFKDRSEGGHRVGADLLQDYQNSLHSWWKSAGWNSINLNDHLGFDPLQMVFGHGFLTVLEPFLNPFHPPDSHTTPPKKYASQTGNRNAAFDQTKSKSKERPADDSKLNLPQLVHHFWVQSVQTPIQAIIKQSQSKSQKSRAQAGSATRTR